MLSAVNQVFIAELCYPQRIRCSLPNWVVRSESAFAAKSVLSLVNLWFAVEIELSAGNYHSLLKMCWLQWISIRCRNCVVRSESAFADESVLSAINLWFATETELSIVN
jgi:hypothetical protein